MTDTETALTTDIPAERDALLFRAGVYPGKGLNGSALTITESDLQAIAANTDSVPLIFAHDAERERLDFGTVGGLEARGNELWGKVRLAAESVSFVAKNGLRSLSVGLDYADKRLKETSFTRRPHIKDAAMFSESDSCAVFSVGEEPENSFDAGEIVEFAESGEHWVTIEGEHVLLKGTDVDHAAIEKAANRFNVGKQGKQVLHDAHDAGKIKTDEHLYRAMAHGKNESEKAGKALNNRVNDAIHNTNELQKSLHADLTQKGMALDEKNLSSEQKQKWDDAAKEKQDAVSVRNARIQNVSTGVNDAHNYQAGVDKHGAKPDAAKPAKPEPAKPEPAQAAGKEGVRYTQGVSAYLPQTTQEKYEFARGALNLHDMTSRVQSTMLPRLSARDKATYEKQVTTLEKENPHFKEAYDNPHTAESGTQAVAKSTAQEQPKTSSDAHPIGSKVAVRMGGKLLTGQVIDHAPHASGMRYHVEVETNSRRNGQIVTKKQRYMVPGNDVASMSTGKSEPAKFSLDTPILPTAQFSCATKGRLMPNLITALLDRLRGKDSLSDEEIAQFTADAYAQDAQFEQDEQATQTALFAEITEAKAETAYGELFAAGKILPPEKPGFIADFCQLASDDRRSPAVITFTEGEKEVKASRVERLKARYADRDKMAMFKEVLDEAPQDALVLFNAMKTKTAGAEKPVTPERIDQLLAMTPEGRAILAERGK